MGRSRSLTFRIIASSGVWVIFALAIAAFLLINSYRSHAARHYDEHVTIHLEELLDASDLNAEGEFSLAKDPTDPRYLILNSGWYWQVSRAGEVLKRSASLGEELLNMGAIQATTEVVIHEISGPANQGLRAHTVKVETSDDQPPLIFLSTVPMAGLSEDISDYSTQIIGSFILLGIGLLMAVVLQVGIATKPLRAIRSGIADIREGNATKLPPSNLEDVQSLVSELNNLLDHNAVLLKRARNQLGDLAHSVKNPLAVINNEARSMQSEQGELIVKQTADIGRNIASYLSRARAYGAQKVLGSRSEVKPAIEDLVFVLKRIYKNKDLEFDCSGLRECWFKGEVQDLEEILGNLMDNACKWASSRILVKTELKGEHLLIVVEDDGLGIPESEIDNVLQRGHRLDESKPGHGQGLGIVKDIVDLYGGSFMLSRGEQGGLRAIVELPAA